MVTCAENITWSRTVYVWSACLKSAGSATFSPFIKSTVCFVCDIGPLLRFAHANCRAVPSKHCWLKPSCNVKAVQTVLLSLEFVFMFDPSVVPAVFCTAGTTATQTQIRKLISYICYPSPRMQIKLIWRLNFHMFFIKLWDCLMFTNSSQCVSNWNKRHSTDSICLEEEPDDVSQSPTPSRSFVKPANTKKAVNEEGVLGQTVSLFWKWEV